MSDWTSVEYLQEQVCVRFESTFNPPNPGDLIAISKDWRAQKYPINGLRLREKGEHSGWYIWLGETLGDDANLFIPLHLSHLEDVKDEALPFLGLDYGWRFLIAPGHVDVWFDESLLSQ